MHNCTDLALIGRSKSIFIEDFNSNFLEIQALVADSSFLIIGGAGSIGQAVTKLLFSLKPRKLHIVDISENNLVELVRDIRSEMGYINGDFATFSVSVNDLEFKALAAYHGPYDYVLNFSALKHVRSESDPFTLMRMLQTNINGALNILEVCKGWALKNYFCISTDKAANPVNLMGASKRIMEMFLHAQNHIDHISMARFANVAFSDGSLLFGFKHRFEKNQPLSAPNDVKRYFITSEEAAVLCVLSTLFAANNEIFFPSCEDELKLTKFSDIALRFLESYGYKGIIFDDEQEARKGMANASIDRAWPCYFFDTDTTGEKEYEEFYTNTEEVDFQRFHEIGIINNKHSVDEILLQEFVSGLKELRLRGSWTKLDIVNLLSPILPELNHKETGKYLDDKM